MSVLREEGKSREVKHWSQEIKCGRLVGRKPAERRCFLGNFVKVLERIGVRGWNVRETILVQREQCDVECGNVRAW
jgi:hypothetical protein